VARKGEHKFLVVDFENGDSHILDGKSEDTVVKKLYEGANFNGGERIYVVRVDDCTIFQAEVTPRLIKLQD
jgi:hypothetical protein